MRDMRFRAWDKESQKMTRVYTLDELLANACPLHEAVKDDYEWMQFTGLLDKNGKEIYEGDRLAINGNERLAGTVVYEHCTFAIKWDKGNKRAELIGEDTEPIFHNCNISLEVIGNIYETEALCK